MKFYAVLADIHGNYPALQAVEKDARAVARAEGDGNVRFVCLGDVVDYGPQPNECMAWVREQVREHAMLVIQGNHEKAVAGPSDRGVYSINKEYWPITLWTRRVLDDQHKDAIRTWQLQRAAPRGLKVFTLLHGSLALGESGYIDSKGAALENLSLLHTHYGLTRYGLFGHTHYQGYFVEDLDGALMFLTCPEGREPRRVNGYQPMQVGVWKPLPKHERALFNPGSVGQPRRHGILMGDETLRDNRAAYMLLRLNGKGQGSFQFRRVKYRVGETIRRLKQIRWPEKPDDKPGGNSIYYEDRSADPLPSNPIDRELAETLAHIQERLPRLVEEALIPALR